MGDLGDVFVQMCNTKQTGNCSECGSFHNVGRSGWSQINCTNGGTEANQILLKFSSLKHIHFKQLEFWGKCKTEFFVRHVLTLLERPLIYKNFSILVL